MITLTQQSKNNTTLTEISKSMDYTINDLAAVAIEDADFIFENQEIIKTVISKNNIILTEQAK
jgi:hypothetical protein